MSEAQRNALILRFMRQEGMELSQAEKHADSILDTIAVEPEPEPEYLTKPGETPSRFVDRLAAEQPTAAGRAVVHHVPVVGVDGLTDRQRSAIGNVGLCANCQQPNDYHLPGCARASGYMPSAKTSDRLPPSV